MSNDDGKKRLRITGYVDQDRLWPVVRFEDGSGSSVKVFDAQTWLAPRGTPREFGAAALFAFGFKRANPNVVEVILDPLLEGALLREEAFKDGVVSAKSFE